MKIRKYSEDKMLDYNLYFSDVVKILAKSARTDTNLNNRVVRSFDNITLLIGAPGQNWLRIIGHII